MKYVFGNWKMYLDEKESTVLAEKLVQTIQVPKDFTCVVFPSTLAFARVRDIVASTHIRVGSQNVSWAPRGAYTGATSAQIFSDSGASHALVGHSERRYIFGETDEAARKKLEACRDAGIVPVVCIGETSEDRENGKAEYRVKKQILKLFENVPLSDVSIIVAYEPVWAIGTGTPCDHAEAARMIELIKNEIKVYYTNPVPVLYGGSVDEQTVSDFMSHSVIDGVLVGSASTDAIKFAHIIEHSVF